MIPYLLGCLELGVNSGPIKSTAHTFFVSFIMISSHKLYPQIGHKNYLYQNVLFIITKFQTEEVLSFRMISNYLGYFEYGCPKGKLSQRYIFVCSHNMHMFRKG